MKLVDKITIWFIVIAFLVTPLCMYISYNNIKKEIDNAEVERMTMVNANVAKQLTLGEQPNRYTQGRPIEITTIAAALPKNPVEVIGTSYYNSDLKRKECLLRVNSYFHIGNNNYKISSYNYVTKANQILTGMENGVLWKMIVITIAFSITARLLSRKLFSPFRKTMKLINNFNLKQDDKIKFPATNTKEFKELNTFLQTMTDKAIEDYSSVKEFSENASHELQTPLAIIRSKLELLSETSIDGSQAILIEDMQNAINKLSLINRSLILLTKLDNEEFRTSENIKFCTITKGVLTTYEDWISLKNLKVNSKLDKNIQVNIHPMLAEMLVTNLLSNAIRHNVEGGTIDINLTQNKFLICNTGLPPQIPTEELFYRFKKSNQSSDSIGLGLAIVKQICEVNHFPVTYNFEGGQHKICVYFGKKEIEKQPKITAESTIEEAVAIV